MPEQKIPTMFADLTPRWREALVGEMVLRVEEPTMERWEAFMGLASDAIDWLQGLKSIAAAFSKAKDTERSAVVGLIVDNLEQLTGAAQKLVRDLLGQRLPELAEIALATSSNAVRLGVKTKAEVQAYAAENMTVRQAVVVLEMLLEVVDVVDLLGKSTSLTQKAAAAFRRTANGEAATAPPA